MQMKRNLLLVAAVAALTLALAGCGQKAATTPSAPADGAKKLIRIGHYGAVCEAPLFLAYEKGFFQREGLEVELLKGDYETNKDGLATGKLQVSDGVLAQWLKPMEQGLNIKFATGIHTGCISGVTLPNSPINGVKDLKGKKIGVSGGVGGGPMNFAFREFLKAGLDPQKDAEWVNYPAAQLIQALEKGEIDAIFTGDTLNLSWEKEKKVKVIASMAKDAPFDDEICCLLTFGGEFLEKDKETAAKVAKAVAEAAKWVQDNPDEAAKIMVEKQYILGTPEINADILRTYKYTPSVELGKRAVKNSAEDFIKAGLIDKNTNVDELVKKVFVELPGIQ